VAAIVSDDALALQRLYDWETAAPDRVVLTQPVGGGEALDYTWRDVGDQSRRMAAHLQSLGLQSGDRVAILSKNTAHWLMSDFAIWLAGGVSVPLYPNLAAPAIRQILEHSDSKLLFVGKLDGWEGMKAGIPAGLSCISHPLSADDAKRSYPQWDGIVAKTSPLAGRPVRPGTSLATIIYTSGTTGVPKGTMHSFAAFAWAVQTALKRFPETEGSRRLSYLPLAHVAERLVVEHMLLAVGTRVYFTESLETFAADMQRARPTSFFSVPRLWLKFQQGILARMPADTLDRLLESPDSKDEVARQILTKLGLDGCTSAACGAAPMPPELLRWYARLGLNIAEAYGMTEIMLTHTTAPGQEAFGTVGLPIPGVECRLDPSDGEIQIKCPTTMLGYYKEPELTSRAFTVDGWLRTGDKGDFDAAGNLKITGRVKDLFKTSKGKYVAPAPIEDKLMMHVAVEACCVTGAGLGQPIALLMLNEFACQNDSANRVNLEVSLGKHMENINSTLDPHERLHCLVALTGPWNVSNDMVTPTLKIKRSRIEDSFGRFYEVWTSLGKPVVWHQQFPV
jgi:long-chain acyl-CoA synthetase